MRHKLADAKASKAEGTSGGSLALFGQQASSSPKRKEKRGSTLSSIREDSDPWGLAS